MRASGLVITKKSNRGAGEDWSVELMFITVFLVDVVTTCYASYGKHLGASNEDQSRDHVHGDSAYRREAFDLCASQRRRRDRNGQSHSIDWL